MNATHAPCFSCRLTVLFILFFLIACCSTSVSQPNTPTHQDDLPVQKLQVYDGVYVTVPKGNDTGKLFSFEIQTNNKSEMEAGRGKKSKKLLERLLPMFIVPFLIQSSIVPLFLSMLKFMLFKSLMVGKLALGLILLNAFKNSNSFKGRDAEIANVHYGYHGDGMHEYGAYVN